MHTSHPLAEFHASYQYFRVVYLPRIEVLGDAMRDLGDFLSRYRQA